MHWNPVSYSNQAARLKGGRITNKLFCFVFVRPAQTQVVSVRLWWMVTTWSHLFVSFLVSYGCNGKGRKLDPFKIYQSLFGNINDM